MPALVEQAGAFAETLKSCHEPLAAEPATPVRTARPVVAADKYCGARRPDVDAPAVVGTGMFTATRTAVALTPGPA
jgi:hypothetical protein